MNKPIALVTGASRRKGIGSAVAIDLAKNGWDIALSYWLDYDKTMPWGSHCEDIAYIQNEIAQKSRTMLYD